VLVDGVIEELKEKYSGNKRDGISRRGAPPTSWTTLALQEREGEEEQTPETPEIQQQKSQTPERDPFRVYGVNVILAHNSEDNSPVIFETTPRTPISLGLSSAPTMRAGAGSAISWICAVVRCSAPMAAS